MNSDSDNPPSFETIAPFKGHEKFLDLVSRQLNMRGVELTSLDEIASKLGVSRASLGHFIEGRHDLVFQCYERAAHSTARRLFEATRDGGSPVSIVRNFVARMLDPAQPEIAVQSEMAMMSASHRDTIEGLHDAVVARLAYLIEDGAHAGEFRDCNCRPLRQQARSRDELLPARLPDLSVRCDAVARASRIATRRCRGGFVLGRDGVSGRGDRAVSPGLGCYSQE
jgi:AcrR family transcriptional regulator